MGDLVKAINTPTPELSPADRAVVNAARDAVQVDGSTVMQKVIDPATFDRFVMAHPGGGTDGFDPSSVRGFVTRAQDTVHLDTPRGVYDGLRLDYPGTHFDPASGADVHVIRYVPEENFAAIPRNADMGGTAAGSPPFTGNGFTSSHDVVPEFTTSPDTVMRDGAEIWQVSESGTQRLVAVLRGDLWVAGGSW